MYIVFTFYVAHKLWGKGGWGGAAELAWGDLMKSLLPFRARSKIFDLHGEKQFWEGFELFKDVMSLSVKIDTSFKKSI